MNQTLVNAEIIDMDFLYGEYCYNVTENGIVNCTKSNYLYNNKNIEI